MANQAEILVDYDDARDHVDLYVTKMNAAIMARSQMVNMALTKFMKFTELKDGDSRLSAIWDLAFAVVSILLPEVGLLIMASKTAKVVRIALEMNLALGTKGAQVVNAAVKTAKVIAKGAKALDIAKDWKEKADKVLADSPSGMMTLSQVDCARGPVRQIIAAAYDVAQTQEDAFTLLQAERNERLAGRPGIIKGSLRSWAAANLLFPVKLTESELEEIQLYMLWLMVKAFVVMNCQMVTTTSITHAHGAMGVNTTTSIEIDLTGINDNQVETALSLFGPKAYRGKFFFEPPLKDKIDLAKRSGCQTIFKKESYTYFTPLARQL